MSAQTSAGSPSLAKCSKLSADQAHADRQYNYDHCLEYGKGVSIDLNEAAKYYKLSGDQGNAAGQFAYGVCLEYGKGVSIDLNEAVKYYRVCHEVLTSRLLTRMKQNYRGSRKSCRLTYFCFFATKEIRVGHNVGSV
jgi:hypothetical protein